MQMNRKTNIFCVGVPITNIYSEAASWVSLEYLFLIG